MVTVADLLNNTTYLPHEVVNAPYPRFDDYNFNIDFPVVINWDEAQHPRDEHGRFGSGGSGSLKESAARMRSSGAGATESHSTGVTAPVDDIIGAIKGGTHTLKSSSTVGAIKQVSQGISDLKASLGKAAWDKLSPQDQASLTALKSGVDAVEHHLEGYYNAGRNAAKEVMKEQGMSADHIETAGRILGTADAAARWTTNIPVAHEAIQALTHIGGPVAFLGAKVGYYTPVASLAYVGASLAKAAIRDIPRVFQHLGAAIIDPLTGSKTSNSPFDTIKIARAAVRGAMQKQEHAAPHTVEGHLAHGVAGAVHILSGSHAVKLAAEGVAHYISHNVAKGDSGTPNLAKIKANAPKVAKYVKDHDNDEQAIAYLYAALDETQGDMDKAIKYANLALDAA